MNHSKINWKKLPYNHKGRWSRNYNSIMTPGAKCTFPQLIAQWVLETRSKYIKGFDIHKGAGWSRPIQRQVSGLVQQSTVLCNYFPHPEDDPLVFQAFYNYFHNNRIFKIGQYRKYRVTKKNTINITKDEKYTVNGIMHEYEKLKNRQEIKPVDKIDINTRNTYKKQELVAPTKGKIEKFLKD